MAKKKSAGKLTQQKRPQPKFLGAKVTNGESVTAGSILVRQRGRKFAPGKNVRLGRDFTLFSTISGKVYFEVRNKKKQISVI